MSRGVGGSPARHVQRRSASTRRDPRRPAVDAATRPRAQEPRSAQGGRRRLRRSGTSLTITLGVAGVLVVAIALLIGLRTTRPGALPGTSVGGVDVGGLERAALVTRLDDLATTRRATPVRITAADHEVETTAGAMGLAVDVEATADAVLRRGRQLNPVTALRDQSLGTLAARGWADVHVAVHEDLDDAVFASWVERHTPDLGLTPVEGAVLFGGGQAQVLPPPPGEVVDAPALGDALVSALSRPEVVDDVQTTEPETVVVELPTTTSRPATTPEEIAALESDAERAVSAPVTLTRGDVSLTVEPAQMADLLLVRAQPVSGDAAAASLDLAVDHRGLAALVPPEQVTRLGSEPRDATFVISGDRIALVPAVDGFTFDPLTAAAQLLDVATGVGPRTAPMEGLRTPADRSTEDVADLGIVEQVATFTTEHACCEGRVANIHRIADLVDGTLVHPGETMSLNRLVGPRTVANGFVDGGAISGGEFVEQIGGGVSQFTTTLFNAVYFGGYEIIDFKPHSYYIPRYPLGREATLNYDPPVDLVWRNDSPHGIYVSASYSATSVTVSLWSTTYATVESQTGDRYAFRPPTERREETDELPRGEEEVEEQGREGFSVDFSRTIRYVDGGERTESFTTNYQPQPRVVLVGTGTGESTEAPSTAEDDDADDATSRPDDPSGDGEAPAPAPPPPAPAPTAPAPAPPPPPEPAPPPAPAPATPDPATAPA